MEDDIEFSNRALCYLNDDQWIPGRGHLIQLSTLHPQPRKAIVSKLFLFPNGDRLVHPFTPIPLGTQAYIISREAAQYALKLSQSLIPAPVDVFLFHPLSIFSMKYPVYNLNPAIIIHDELYGIESTILNKTLMTYKSKNRSSTWRSCSRILLHSLRSHYSNETLLYL